jgi:pyrimidine operon attenuation protein/uracil phosphoribosyltransferase
MSTTDPPRIETTVVMSADAIEEALDRLAREIVEDNPDIESLALLGILRRGRPLADRLASLIESMTGKRPRLGSLGVTLYRDDLRAGVRRTNLGGGQTHFDFTVDGLTVVLVDDVIAAGRTVRAALDEVMDYGRPRRVQLACLVDRGLRELPIQPDYRGWTVSTRPNDNVAVRLKEFDGEDVVLLERLIEDPTQGGE